MNYNDVLRRMRYALDAKDQAMVDIFALSGLHVVKARLLAFLKKEGEMGYLECDSSTLCSFLDGLIIQRRGAPKDSRTIPPVPDHNLTNNLIMKKIRIALELKEDDMLRIFELAEFRVTKSELSAFFRKKGHRNHKECGDQVLRNFLKGLTKYLRV